jgi:hypothetical protein
MALANNVPVMLREWARKKTKDFTANTVWGNLSNLREPGRSLPNAREFKVPDSVLHYVGGTFQRGVFNVTVPLIKSLRKPGKGGMQNAEGSGETPDAFSCTVYYNNITKVMNTSTKGVENQSTAYLGVAQQAHTMISDWFEEELDKCCQQALCDGSSQYLTDAQYWEDYKDVKTPQITKALHPNLTWTGATSALNRGADYAGDIANLITALGSLSAANVFSLSALDGAIQYAHRHIVPLKWSSEGGQINYIILISPMQAQDLMKDQEWVNITLNADKRGPKNRALTGIIGRRGDALVIEDQRSPIFHLDTNTDFGATGFEYCDQQAASDKDSFYGIANLNRVTKGSGAVGTCEVARLLGRGAIASPLINGLSYEVKESNFNKQQETAGSMDIGHQRMDFVGRNSDGTQKTENASSGLYFTATPSVAY